MTLETPTNKQPGTEVRLTEPERPAVVGLMILGLTAVEFVFVFLVLSAIAIGANSPNHVSPGIASAPLGGLLKSDQQIVSFWLACIFYNLAFITFLYQRYFMAHSTIAKRRFRKWEDEGVQLR